MLKERDVVNGNLDAQNDPKLIVHLDTDWSHTMLDPSSQDANIKIVSHFAFVISVELMSKESGDVLRFGLKLGLVINFGQKLVKDGIHRVVNGL